jgi:hypothetical protein
MLRFVLLRAWSMLLFSSMGWVSRLLDRFRKYSRGNAVRMFTTYHTRKVVFVSPTCIKKGIKPLRRTPSSLLKLLSVAV